MNIHEAAKSVIAKIEETDVMSDLKHAGLCFLMKDMVDHLLYSEVTRGAEPAYQEIAHFLDNSTYIGGREDKGLWTPHRMNCLALLAVTDPEDFLGDRHAS